MNSSGMLMSRVTMVSYNGFVLLFLCLVHVALAYVNYLAIKQTLLLFNFDASPVMLDQLSGWIFEATGFDRVTQCDLLAAIVSIVIGLATFSVFNTLFTAFKIYQEFDEYRASGDLEVARRTINRKLIFSAACLIPYVLLVCADIVAFRARAATWVLQLDEGSDVSMTLPVWPTIVKDYGQLYGIEFINYMALAYLACVILVSLLIELRIEKFNESLVQLNEAVKLVQEEYEQTPAASAQPAVGTVAAQASVAPAPLAVTSAEAAPVPTVASSPANGPDAQTSSPVNWSAPTREDEHPVAGPLFAFAAPPAGSHPHPPVTVYAGDSGEKITISEALANPNDYYFDELGRVWKFASQPAAAAA